MKIAFTSGKGGTGKTTVATNLAYFLAKNGRQITYWDCDVEEPNGYLFFDLEEHYRKSVTIPIPTVNMDACDLCGKCGDFCEYGAIVTLGKKVLTFPELCHGCGGCSLICPQDAILEFPREIGEVIHLSYKGNPNLKFIYGLLNLGEPMAAPIIKKVKLLSNSSDTTIIDSPPGTSCPVIESVKGSDFVVLVTEPTPFGLNDLQLAIEMVEALKLPFGVIINQVGLGDDRVHHYCSERNIPILLEIPYSRQIAELYSRGVLFLTKLPHYEWMFQSFIQSIELRMT